ncbi:hypothetical protein GCM10028803_21400 [Larkinella knui]|uniref:Uncharacterized protein n=1 Tax=Larkinella knui TaxID=2025310 RepID=A0A3P1CVC6_9BACT|nr:tetratricopeptide repeat-containing sensor histidine kinase [Larkinella knui]RRB17223.1 hypothetical protein EHT87_02770 [Larkinella knui]
MKLFQHLVLFMGLLGVSFALQAQRYETPPFNFDRNTDQPYVDSLLRVTRIRLLELDGLRPTPTVDTARMEYQYFLAHVQYSGITYRDSALFLANQLIRYAERKKNLKYQIKALLLVERYYRAHKTNYPQALRLNYRILSLVEMNPRLYGSYVWRIYRNMGQINCWIGEYDEAVAYLQKSIAEFGKENRNDPTNLADLHQFLADAYKRQGHLDKAESHYLLAWDLLNQNGSWISNKAYLTNEIGRLYSSLRKTDQAVWYLKQSVAYWDQLKSPLPQSDALADLAEAYFDQGQYAEAITTAKAALAKNQKVHSTMLTAYGVLVKTYEHQQDWKNAFAYQRLYNDKKEEQHQAINPTESIHMKAKLASDWLESMYLQEQLAQNQRYEMLAKQAEIDRLQNAYKTNELLGLARTNTLKLQLETQQLKNVAAQKQARQQATIKQLHIERLRLGLAAQKGLRNQLFAGIAIISLLGILLLYYSLRLRRTNQALLTKNREIEIALIRGQTIERKRVATELHDRVSSLLGATKMTFQTIDSEMLTPRNKKLYENSLNLLNDAVAQVHQLSRNLIPEQLLQQDLVVSLKNLVSKLNLVGKTVFSLALEPAENFPLTQEAKFNLYVICLELCTNILRHARARTATIELVQHDDCLVLQLYDDGIGLIHSTEVGMGLHNIRERAETIGAQFWMESGESNGTKASITLPLTFS